jgi:hypothetical protein
MPWLYIRADERVQVSRALPVDAEGPPSGRPGPREPLLEQAFQPSRSQTLAPCWPPCTCGRTAAAPVAHSASNSLRANFGFGAANEKTRRGAGGRRLHGLSRPTPNARHGTDQPSTNIHGSTGSPSQGWRRSAWGLRCSPLAHVLPIAPKRRSRLEVRATQRWDVDPTMNGLAGR